MLYGILYLWFVLVLLSLIFIAYDMQKNTPVVGVMKLAWLLVTIYTGPFALFIYLISCRQPLPNTHNEIIKAHWKQTVGSILHCLSGDATGIIIGAIIAYALSVSNGIDLIIEYIAGFSCGLLLFQAVFMLPMLGGNYLIAVKKTFFAEFVSMNMLMIGMFPVMIILMYFFPEGRQPTSIVFWGIMSVASIVGSLTAYPINSWMVRAGIKHGMVTKGGHDNKHSDEQIDHHEYNHPNSHTNLESHSNHITLRKQILVSVITFMVMVLTVYCVSLFIPISFSLR